jgi:2-acylglycerol O-acyltransferase 2
MLEHTFPLSYIAISLGFLLGIGFTSVFISFVSASIILLLAFTGIIRVMPIINLFKSLSKKLLPDQLNTIEENIKKSFNLTADLKEDKYIYMWHPHSVFSTSLFFHNVTKFTEWPSHLRNLKVVVFSYLQWFPFAKEFFEEFNLIPSDYFSMKTALEDGNSISVSAGGMREMLYENTAIISKRRGIFKMALETGTALVPIVSVGETKVWELAKIPQWIHDSMEPYDACMAIPTFKSILRFIGLLENPLKDPIRSVLGKPIRVEKKDIPTEQDISNLRSTYISALKTLYKKESGCDMIVV